jgi:hypothetical protein
MNRCSALFLFAVAIVPVGGCGLAGLAGSGVPASRSVDAKDFTTVEVNGPFEVTLERGDKFNVTVTSDDNLLQFIDVLNPGGKLSIRIQSEENLRPKSGLKAKINMPAIEAVNLRAADHSTASRASRISGSTSRAPARSPATFRPAALRSRQSGPARLN